MGYNFLIYRTYGIRGFKTCGFNYSKPTVEVGTEFWGMTGDVLQSHSRPFQSPTNVGINIYFVKNMFFSVFLFSSFKNQ